MMRTKRRLPFGGAQTDAPQAKSVSLDRRAVYRCVAAHLRAKSPNRKEKKKAKKEKAKAENRRKTTADARADKTLNRLFAAPQRVASESAAAHSAPPPRRSPSALCFVCAGRSRAHNGVAFGSHSTRGCAAAAKSTQRCGACERATCGGCARLCADCGGATCALCCQMSYAERYERLLCVACFEREALASRLP